ncbi:MAG: FecR domain-containing protein [Pseudomonadota bacterium]
MLSNFKSIDPKIIEEAAEWLTRFKSEEMNPTLKKEWELWRNKSPMHESAWHRAESLLNTLDQLSPDVVHNTLDIAGKASKRRFIKTMALAIIASPLLWLSYREVSNSKWKADYRTEKGEIRRFTLADSTQLELNTDSAVNVIISENKRRIELISGEIRVKTGQHEFRSSQRLTVSSTHGYMQPIGTQFSVRQFDEATLLSVYEGQVDLTTAMSKQQMRIPAGKQVRFTATTTSKIKQAADDSALWERGMLLARDVRLGKLITELARYRAGFLRCEEGIANMLVSGAFPVSNTDKCLALLESTLPVTIHQFSPWWVTVKSK